MKSLKDNLLQPPWSLREEAALVAAINRQTKNDPLASILWEDIGRQMSAAGFKRALSAIQAHYNQCAYYWRKVLRSGRNQEPRRPFEVEIIRRVRAREEMSVVVRKASEEIRQKHERDRKQAEQDDRKQAEQDDRKQAEQDRKQAEQDRKQVEEKERQRQQVEATNRKRIAEQKSHLQPSAGNGDTPKLEAKAKQWIHDKAASGTSVAVALAQQTMALELDVQQYLANAQRWANGINQRVKVLEEAVERLRSVLGPW